MVIFISFSMKYAHRLITTTVINISFRAFEQGGVRLQTLEDMGSQKGYVGQCRYVKKKIEKKNRRKIVGAC